MADFIQNDIEEEDGSSVFSIRNLITIVYLNWYWILLSVLVCLLCAKLYLRYTPPVYSAGMKVLIKDERGGSRRSGISTNTLEEMGVISTSNGFSNELEILSSTAIATRVVRNLKLYVSYRLEGRVADRELYKDTPIIVDIAEDNLDALNTSISLGITRKGKGIHVEGAIGGSAPISKDLPELPAVIQTAVGPLIFQQNPGYSMNHQQLFVSIVPPITAARAYTGRLSTVVSGDATTVASIRMVDTQMNRALDYLTELMNSYNVDANEDKNEVARKTEEFIKERIEVIRGELDSTEVSLETFKKTHELINLANDATTALSNSNSYQQRQVEMQTQLTLLKALIDYVGNPDNMLQVIPSNMGLSNAVLNTTLSEYNSLVMQRNKLLKASSESSPSVIKLTNQLEGLWPTIGSTLRASYQDMMVRKNSIDDQYNMFNARIANTPTQERILNNIGRQQEIKAGLYLMLLQKREQNFISLASTATKARIIDAPRPTGMVSPDSRKIQMMALGIGLIFPIALIFVLSLLRYRIEGRDDVERLTRLPILADIPMATMKDNDGSGIVVSENKNSMMEEAFRGLRTNLRFILPAPEKVVACTSCIPGEGKTFVASNLAVSLSLLGKHVLLIGLDIRKPRLGAMFKLSKHKKGITSFLMLDKPDYELLEEQISYGVANKNLDILPAGIIPPNPTELISRPRLDEAINYLRGKYDYIVLDTPPIGLVSDTLELARTADATIFVCRADYSIKANFNLINNIHKDNKMPKINLVLNGIDLKKKKYGYYYGYGKYGTYGKNGKYGYYGKYSHYGHYGVYGSYHSNSNTESNE